MTKKAELLKAKKLLKELCVCCLENKRCSKGSYCKKCIAIKAKENYKRRWENGICLQCGQPSRKGKGLCEEHAKSASERSRRWQRKNLKPCPTCGRWSKRLDEFIEEEKQRKEK